MLTRSQQTDTTRGMRRGAHRERRKKPGGDGRDGRARGARRRPPESQRPTGPPWGLGAAGRGSGAGRWGGCLSARIVKGGPLGVKRRRHPRRGRGPSRAARLTFPNKKRPRATPQRARTSARSEVDVVQAACVLGILLQHVLEKEEAVERQHDVAHALRHLPLHRDHDRDDQADHDYEQHHG